MSNECIIQVQNNYSNAAFTRTHVNNCFLEKINESIPQNIINTNCVHNKTNLLHQIYFPRTKHKSHIPKTRKKKYYCVYILFFILCVAALIAITIFVFNV